MGTLFTDLTWWQVGLVIVYAIYTLIRSIWIFNAGLKDALIGYSEDIKLYHVIWAIIDIPAIVLGKFFPVLKLLFNIPVFPLKKDKK